MELRVTFGMYTQPRMRATAPLTAPHYRDLFQQFFVVLPCHYTVLDEFNQHFLASVHFPLTSAFDKFRQHCNKFLGTLRIEPEAAGWEASVLPLCFAPPLFQQLFVLAAVCEEIQRRIKSFQHKVGRMSIMDPTQRHKRKSTFFTPTPGSTSTSATSPPSKDSVSNAAPAPKLNFNVKNPRKALLEKLLEPGDHLVQTVQVQVLDPFADPASNPVYCSALVMELSSNLILATIWPWWEVATSIILGTLWP